MKAEHDGPEEMSEDEKEAAAKKALGVSTDE